MPVKDFILASGSPQRKQLLIQIGFPPKKIEGADIDESEKKGEKPTAYVKRMAIEKAEKVWQQNVDEVVLGSDTIVAVGRKILHKSQNDEEQTAVMKLLSGKAHQVITAVCVIDKKGKKSVKVVSTRVVTKTISVQEIAEYVATKEWVGCCGYKIEGTMAAFVKKIIGSHSSIVGLPLFEARNMLIGVGVK
ncbi:MAG: Maf family protein [Alphaproteobacteria bacterium]|nr:Maf family protein [Alphaproteobacteria bacterium]